MKPLVWTQTVFEAYAALCNDFPILMGVAHHRVGSVAYSTGSALCCKVHC